MNLTYVIITDKTFFASNFYKEPQMMTTTKIGSVAK